MTNIATLEMAFCVSVVVSNVLLQLWLAGVIVTSTTANCHVCHLLKNIKHEDFISKYDQVFIAIFYLLMFHSLLYVKL